MEARDGGAMLMRSIPAPSIDQSCAATFTYLLLVPLPSRPSNIFLRGPQLALETLALGCFELSNLDFCAAASVGMAYTIFSVSKYRC